MIDSEQTTDQPIPGEPSREERIREAAYQRYVARGHEQGDASADWLEAEAEVDAHGRTEPDATAALATPSGSPATPPVAPL